MNSFARDYRKLYKIFFGFSSYFFILKSADDIKIQ